MNKSISIDPSPTVNCPTCEGKKTVTVRFSEWNSDKPAEESDIECVTCRGKGVVTIKYAKLFNKIWGEANWCSCTKSFGSRRERKGGQDYYYCYDCNKTTQIG